ncbi:hypothetical protein NDI76_21995 [Halogeometricum sp. S1BR25-6]|uniref:Uncharacterized protein n=1 Tax=Halogeometricum salsisoli TaxID=2950536 RepID=A0ABU2GKR8_9EURY|nr:hypothetical protein [Halogeometricum sp. S1BR25-6]MDS0301405.1 hypothetical protein [Halogeometricum sp. S1BR25-6]
MPVYDIVHVWRGNYWSEAPGVRETQHGRLRRSYRPTGPVDSAVGRVHHAETVAHSPAVTLLRQLQQFVPRLRTGGVVDPVADPIREDAVDRVYRRYNRTGKGVDDDPWDYRS